MVNRKPRKETQCMMNKKCTFGDVQQLALIDCCKLKCCQAAKCTTILELRMEFWNMTLENQMAYIFNAFGNSIRTNTNGVVSYLFGFCGKDICYRAWYELHGISKTSFYRYKEQHNAGYTRAMRGLDSCINFIMYA